MIRDPTEPVELYQFGRAGERWRASASLDWGIGAQPSRGYWLGEGHSVTGWTIEQEVHTSILAHDENEKYLPGTDLSGLHVDAS